MDKRLWIYVFGHLNQTEIQKKTKTKTQQVKTPTRGRFAPLAQVPLLAFLFSFSFEFLFDLNDQKRISTRTFIHNVGVVISEIRWRPDFDRRDLDDGEPFR